MPCEKYQDALIDLAASAAEPSDVLRAHLDECTSCRSYMEDERFLTASIDSVLRQTANAPLPPALLQRLDARLGQQTPPKPALYPSWLYASAALTTAVLLLLGLPRLRTRDANQQGVVSVPVRQATATQAERVALSAPRSLAPMATRHKNKPASQPPNPSDPEVLVPPDERIAFERFLSDLNGREDLAIALVKPMQEQRQPHTASVAMPAPVEVPDLETIALTVQPLSEIADR
jgi:hypothetical protein